MGGEELREHHEPERGQQAPEQPAEISLAVGGDLRVLPQGHEERTGVPGHDRDRNREQEREPCGVAHHRPDPAEAAGAEVLGHDRSGAGEDAHREGAEHPEEVARERARRDRLGADPAHHDDVGEQDGHVGEVAERQRAAPGERNRAGFAPPGREGGRGQRVHGEAISSMRRGAPHESGSRGTAGYDSAPPLQPRGAAKRPARGVTPCAVETGPVTGDGGAARPDGTLDWSPLHPSRAFPERAGTRWQAIARPRNESRAMNSRPRRRRS